MTKHLLMLNFERHFALIRGYKRAQNMGANCTNIHCRLGTKRAELHKGLIIIKLIRAKIE